MYQGHFGEISNKADWSAFVEIIDDDTGDVVDLSVASQVYFEIKSPRGRGVLVSASLTDGKITLQDDNTAQISLSADDLRNVPPGQYRAALSFTLDNKKHDPVLGSISIVEGAG